MKIMKKRSGLYHRNGSENCSFSSCPRKSLTKKRLMQKPHGIGRRFWGADLGARCGSFFFVLFPSSSGPVPAGPETMSRCCPRRTTSRAHDQ